MNAPASSFDAQSRGPELYVRKLGRVTGPFDINTLRRMVQRGKLSSFHEVSRDRKEWMTVDEFGGPSAFTDVQAVKQMMEKTQPSQQGSEQAVVSPDNADLPVAVRPAMEQPAEMVPPETSGGYDFSRSVESEGDNTSKGSSRKSENPMLATFKVIGGAMLSVPLAQLILWWLPGDWSRDPMDIGPKFSRYVPWVVPKKYHKSREQKTTENPLEMRPFPVLVVRSESILFLTGGGTPRSPGLSRLMDLRWWARQHPG